ncbi:MAG: sigma-70 family RNA polymerase sigma factor [Acidobacteria bacterium]|nr:sigma-70 family RNA polymerase sigma factor [Acidobacteriota bacterium]
MASPEGVSELLVRWSNGDQSALEKLTPLVYDELHRLARRYMRKERSDHSLQTTALVHEAYLRLVDQTDLSCRHRSEFLAIAANLMRQILINYALKRSAGKREGGQRRVTLAEATGAALESDLDFIALDKALDELATLDPRQAQIVQLRFFAGATIEETAEVLQVSPATVKREWTAARAWLHRAMTGDG